MCVDIPGERALVSSGYGFLHQLQTHIHHVYQEGEGGVHIPTQHSLAGGCTQTDSQGYNQRCPEESSLLL